MASKILVVEDEKDIRHALECNLRRDGYHVITAADGESALAKFHKVKPDLVILDIMLPAMDGLEVLHQIRRNSQTPAILLTAKSKEMDRVLGLRLGADDYMVKPFSMDELIARIQCILRRTAAASDCEIPVFSLGTMQVDFGRHEVKVRGHCVNLTPKEFALLKLLIEAKGKVLSRGQILQCVWKHDSASGIDTRTVDQHIARLRHKLKHESTRVATVTNAGYKLVLTQN